MYMNYLSIAYEVYLYRYRLSICTYSLAENCEIVSGV